MTGTRGTGFHAEDIISLHEQAAAMPAILSGVLDDKIKETKAAIAELARRKGIAKTQDDADAVLEKANGQADSIRRAAEADAAATLDGAKQVRAEADSMAAKASTAMQSARSMSEQANAALAAAQAEGEATRALKADLASQAAALDKRAATLATREAKLKTDQATLNARLESLKV